jgi:hypothetical protein
MNVEQKAAHERQGPQKGSPEAYSHARALGLFSGGLPANGLVNHQHQVCPSLVSSVLVS